MFLLEFLLAAGTGVCGEVVEFAAAFAGRERDAAVAGRLVEFIEVGVGFAFFKGVEGL